jgi:hypothetical protein
LKWHKYVHKYSPYTIVIGNGRKEEWLRENTQEAVDLINNDALPAVGTRYFIQAVKTANQAERSLMGWIYR